MIILVLEPVDDNGLAWLHRHDYRVIRAFDGARWDALSDEVEALIVRSAPWTRRCSNVCRISGSWASTVSAWRTSISLRLPTATFP